MSETLYIPSENGAGQVDGSVAGAVRLVINRTYNSATNKSSFNVSVQVKRYHNYACSFRVTVSNTLTANGTTVLTLNGNVVNLTSAKNTFFELASCSFELEHDANGDLNASIVLNRIGLRDTYGASPMLTMYFSTSGTLHFSESGSSPEPSPDPTPTPTPVSSTVEPNAARLELIGKSWPDVIVDSGPGLNIDDIPSFDLDPYDYGWSSYIDVFDNLPAYIQIERLPYSRYLTYKDGQKIKIVGIRVKAFYANGNAYIDSYGHTDNRGYINTRELRFTPRVAGFLSMSDLITRSERFSQSVANRHFTATAEDYASIYINENDYYWMKVTFISEKMGACGSFNDQTAVATTLVYQNGEDKLYMSQEYDYSHACGEHLIPYYDEYAPLTAQAIRDEINTVVISWPRPGDGQLLEASYEITVSADDNDTPGNGGR